MSLYLFIIMIQLNFRWNRAGFLYHFPRSPRWFVIGIFSYQNILPNRNCALSRMLVVFQLPDVTTLDVTAAAFHIVVWGVIWYLNRNLDNRVCNDPSCFFIAILKVRTARSTSPFDAVWYGTAWRLDVSNSIFPHEFFKFVAYKGRTIVQNYHFGQSLASECHSQFLNRYLAIARIGDMDIQPFGMGIDYQ